MGVLYKEDLPKVWAKIVELFATKRSVTKLTAIVDEKATKATTLAGYGIGDAYTKKEVDDTISSIKTDISSVYKVKGTVAFADLPKTNQSAGDVYNVSDEFTVKEGFVDYQAGSASQKTYPAGTNVVWTSGGWDCLAGTYDFSGFAKKTDLPTNITQEEIDAICVLPNDMTV